MTIVAKKRTEISTAHFVNFSRMFGPRMDTSTFKIAFGLEISLILVNSMAPIKYFWFYREILKLCSGSPEDAVTQLTLRTRMAFW